jgi:pimeloyl-ACP methyl ester carboxylesterase
MTQLLATRTTFLTTTPETRREFLEQLAVMDLRPELSSISTPTIVVSGTLDTLLAHKLSKALASAIDGARLIAVPGAGHQLPFETPDRVAEILADASRTASRTAHASDPQGATP